MAVLLCKFRQIGEPSEGELFDGRNIDVPVAEPFGNLGHILVEKSAILGNGIAAEKVATVFPIVLHRILANEVESRFFGGCRVVSGMANPLY